MTEHVHAYCEDGDCTGCGKDVIPEGPRFCYRPDRRGTR